MRFICTSAYKEKTRRKLFALKSYETMILEDICSLFSLNYVIITYIYSKGCYLCICALDRVKQLHIKIPSNKHKNCVFPSHFSGSERCTTIYCFKRIYHSGILPFKIS